MQGRSPLRIGCVKYLNARPLIHGWPGKVDFDSPSALCARLARGELDVALVSSLEYLRNPIYRIVDGVSIASDGPVYSVIVAHRGEVSQIPQIELDPASETSVALLRCLLHERRLNPGLIKKIADPDAGRLLIGDRAIRLRRSSSDLEFWDLGAEWKSIVDLPFVYALWLVRPEVGDAESIAHRLRALRDQNLSSIDSLIAEEGEFDREFCSRYYREHIRFTFGEREKKGLQAFAAACVALDLIPHRDLAVNVV